MKFRNEISVRISTQYRIIKHLLGTCVQTRRPLRRPALRKPARSSVGAQPALEHPASWEQHAWTVSGPVAKGRAPHPSNATARTSFTGTHAVQHGHAMQWARAPPMTADCIHLDGRHASHSRHDEHPEASSVGNNTLVNASSCVARLGMHTTEIAALCSWFQLSYMRCVLTLFSCSNERRQCRAQPF